MLIQKLKLKNYRGISDAEMDFEGKSTIIYGINGMGKSTILDACNILFSKILNEVTCDEQLRGLMIRQQDVKIGEDTVEISAEIVVEDKKFTYYRKRLGELNTNKKVVLTEMADYIREQYVGSLCDEEVDDNMEGQHKIILNDKNIPIYVFYGVNRYIREERPLRRKYTGTGGKLEAWKDHIFSGIVSWNTFFEWFRGRQEYENSIKVDEATFQDEQLSAAKEAILQALGKNFTSIKVKIEDTPDLVVEKNGVELSCRQLSEGENSIIALVGDIARRLSIANTSNLQPLTGKGIVLIDEIDLHLHPSWQARILPILMKVFPNIQFIVTTHSPKVLGEVGEEVNLFNLLYQEDGVTVQQMAPLNGWDVNTILSDYMDTDKINKNTRELIELIHNLIEENRYDEAEKQIDKLEDMTDSDNIEVVRGRVLIARRK